MMIVTKFISAKINIICQISSFIWEIQVFLLRDHKSQKVEDLTKISKLEKSLTIIRQTSKPQV